MARVLDVYLCGKLIGQLSQDDSGALGYRYTAGWLEDPRAVPLSRSLPLQAAAFERQECRPFFAGLLPEDGCRELIAKRFGISERNDFALLEKIGGECAGAVSLMPAGETPPTVVGNYREISDRELARLMEILPQRPLLAGEEGVRLSLAGAQGKLAVTLRNGVMLLPQHGAPSTHILKPSSQIFSGLVENEHFCMTLAARLGLPVAPVAIGNAQGIRYLQVARYDRRIMPDGEVERLHQEDFCQAMGIAPELKYQQEGGPNLKKCFELIRGASSVPGPDVLRLFDAVVFNYLIGNNDAHGKNFSLLHDGMGTRLAPLYDLVCTQAWQNLSTTLAMKIGGERKPNRVFVENWRRFFKDAGVAEPQAVKRLLAMTRQTIETTRMVTPGYPVCESVLPPLLENCRRVLALEW